MAFRCHVSLASCDLGRFVHLPSCFVFLTIMESGFPGGSVERIHLQCRRCRFNSLVRKIPWRRAWQPIPVLLPGKSHGQRRLLVYSQSMGIQRVGHDWACMHNPILYSKLDSIYTSVHCIYRSWKNSEGYHNKLMKGMLLNCFTFPFCETGVTEK